MLRFMVACFCLAHVLLAQTPVSPSSEEFRFFERSFRSANGPGHETEMKETFATIAEQVEAVRKAGAHVTLGSMLALILFESNLRIEFLNTKCSENSFRKQLKNPQAC